MAPEILNAFEPTVQEKLDQIKADRMPTTRAQMLKRISDFKQIKKNKIPVTVKDTDYDANEFYYVGTSGMQGWPKEMEDFHKHVLSYNFDPTSAFFAVYDGHFGTRVVEYVHEELHKYILRRPEYQNDVSKALTRAFLEIDRRMAFTREFSTQKSGTTAVTVIIKNNILYCANLGDSRAIGCVNGRMVILSLDQKPNNLFEMQRIQNAGGLVVRGYINGVSSVSRALGDFPFKRLFAKKYEQQLMTAIPEIKPFVIDETWEFVLLASAGVWEVMNRIAGCEFCRARIANNMKPQDICEELLEKCLAPAPTNDGGTNNMTVVLVCFLHNKPFDSLATRCSRDFHS